MGEAPEFCELCGGTEFIVGFMDGSDEIWWVCAGCGKPALDKSVDKVNPSDE